jgi:hypothetical protein
MVGGTLVRRRPFGRFGWSVTAAGYRPFGRDGLLPPPVIRPFGQDGAGQPPLSRWIQALRQRIMPLPDRGQMTFGPPNGTTMSGAGRLPIQRRKPLGRFRAARFRESASSPDAMRRLRRVVPRQPMLSRCSGAGSHAPPHQASSRRRADDQPASFRSRVAVSICGVKRRSGRQRSTKRSGSGKKPACKPAR